MNEKEEFLKRILSAFKIEAGELIAKITWGLQELEKEITEEKRQEVLELIYRQIQALKGAAQAVDRTEVESILQRQERLFSMLKAGKTRLTKEGIDLLHKSIETISGVLSAKTEGEDSARYDVNGMMIKLQKLLVAMKSEHVELVEKEAVPPSETILPEIVENKQNEALTRKSEPTQISNDQSRKNTDTELLRVSTARLNTLLMQLEELLSVKLSTIQMTRQLREMIRNFQSWETGAKEIYPSVRVLRGRVKQNGGNADQSIEERALRKTLRFLQWGNTLAKKTEAELTKLLKNWDEESSEICLQIDTLLYEVKKIMTVPFAEVLELFPKIVRDLSRENGKSVKLIIRGEGIEIDRRILERLKNPLIHLLRNCLDHGIEKPSVRKVKNKSEMGVIRINLERSENKRIRFTIEDDGAGIDLKKLKMAVLDQQGVKGDDLESQDKLIRYIYKSGISTSEIITDLSGRGMGLAILKSSIEDLEGTIEVETEKDKGTRFTIELPVSLVTFRGILVRAGAGKYVIPSTKTDRILTVKKEDVITIQNTRMIYYERELVPLVNLTNILEKDFEEKPVDRYLVMLINNKGIQTAIQVEGIEEEQEILVKSFNRHLQRVRNIAGAAILGSGEVVLILNPADMVKTVFKNMELRERNQELDQILELKNRILVVEDSLTSRMLIKTILESAGYKVETAFDGIDGFTKIKDGKYDLVISDVNMPRMSGFDLIARIRSDSEISSIPVVIVTSSNTSEDMQRGEEVGANGFILKRNIAQSNLLGLIEKLIQELLIC